MIKRIYDLKNLIQKGKVLIIYGPRQAGKTTLIKQFITETKLKCRYDTGDSFQVAEALSKCTYESTDNHVGKYDLIVIDEAQKIPHIGNALKLMVDRHPDKYFIVSGSSSFDLANKTDESLTGRKKIITLYPISQMELEQEQSRSELLQELYNYLIYGNYPEIITTPLKKEKEEKIRLIADSYLIKDILELDRIKKHQALQRLLRLLAFQIGMEVSAHELGKQVGLDTKTVLSYLDLLEKSFVIFSLSGFSKNLRKEVNKMSKYYFYDTGIRNALISNFNQKEERNDIGPLWENFLVLERLKRNTYQGIGSNYYFWRTYDQREIDFIEERGGNLYGYEFKWRPKNSKSPQLWLETYKNAQYQEINQGNYLDFVL